MSPARPVLIGLLIIALVGGGYVIVKRRPIQSGSSVSRPTDDVLIPIDTNLETASLTPPDDESGIGIATRQVVDQIVVFGVSAALPIGSTGESYVVWLLPTSESTTGRRVGTLTEQADQYSFNLTAPVMDGLESFVRITRQRSITEPIGPTVLEGAFQVTQ